VNFASNIDNKSEYLVPPIVESSHTLSRGGKSSNHDKNIMKNDPSLMNIFPDYQLRLDQKPVSNILFNNRKMSS
jgi:hypothetical protein